MVESPFFKELTMYCKCDNRKEVKIVINKESIKVCSKNLGGCGCEINDAIALSGRNNTIKIDKNYISSPDFAYSKDGYVLRYYDVDSGEYKVMPIK